MAYTDLNVFEINITVLVYLTPQPRQTLSSVSDVHLRMSDFHLDSVYITDVHT